MPLELDAAEARILGSLVEKSFTTPEQYPLSFNALINACNQKSSRDPLMSLDSNAVGQSVSSLIKKDLVERLTGSRVPKIAHHIENLLDTDDPKTVAPVCVLLLRGPQTPGEIKSRTERMHKFANAAEVEALLQDLSAREDGPFVAQLPRQAGQKETRYQHLFSGAVAAPKPKAARPAAKQEPQTGLEQRLESLESLCKDLESRIDRLEKR